MMTQRPSRTYRVPLQVQKNKIYSSKTIRRTRSVKELVSFKIICCCSVIVSLFLFSFRHNLGFYCQCLGCVPWLLASLLLQDIFWFGVQVGNDAWKENSCKYSAICMFFMTALYLYLVLVLPRRIFVFSPSMCSRDSRSAAKKSDFKWAETSLELLIFKGIVTLTVHTFSHDAGVQRMLLKMQLLLCSTETCVGI